VDDGAGAAVEIPSPSPPTTTPQAITKSPANNEIKTRTAQQQTDRQTETKYRITRHKYYKFSKVKEAAT
jgi:hypothetical protein